MIGYFTDFCMLEHLPYDVRQNTDLFNHLRQFPVNTAPLERASGLANRYLYSLEINFNSNLLTYLLTARRTSWLFFILDPLLDPSQLLVYGFHLLLDCPPPSFLSGRPVFLFPSRV